MNSQSLQNDAELELNHFFVSTVIFCRMRSSESTSPVSPFVEAATRELTLSSLSPASRFTTTAPIRKINVSIDVGIVVSCFLYSLDTELPSFSFEDPSKKSFGRLLPSSSAGPSTVHLNASTRRGREHLCVRSRAGFRIWSISGGALETLQEVSSDFFAESSRRSSFR